MQNRYVGDIGDYFKYAILRHIGKRRKLGVAWYLFPDENGNNDGRYIEYLHQKEKYRWFDKELFDNMKNIVFYGDRNIKSIEDGGILGDCIFHNKEINFICKGLGMECENPETPIPPHRWKCRDDWRKKWFSSVLETLKDCDIVFADPDNGIARQDKFKGSRKRFGKSISEEEVDRISSGRCSIIYHHNTRFKGGHIKEVEYWMDRIKGRNMALRFKRLSPRTFFIINPDKEIEKLVFEFANRWNLNNADNVDLFPIKN